MAAVDVAEHGAQDPDRGQGAEHGAEHERGGDVEVCPVDVGEHLAAEQLAERGERDDGELYHDEPCLSLGHDVAPAPATR